MLIRLRCCRGVPPLYNACIYIQKRNCRKSRSFPSAASGRPFGRVMEKNNVEHIAFSQGRPAVVLHVHLHSKKELQETTMFPSAASGRPSRRQKSEVRGRICKPSFDGNKDRQAPKERNQKHRAQPCENGILPLSYSPDRAKSKGRHSSPPGQTGSDSIIHSTNHPPFQLNKPLCSITFLAAFPIF
jgi:hypothetical protein